MSEENEENLKKVDRNTGLSTQGVPYTQPEEDPMSYDSPADVPGATKLPQAARGREYNSGMSYSIPGIDAQPANPGQVDSMQGSPGGNSNGAMPDLPPLTRISSDDVQTTSTDLTSLIEADENPQSFDADSAVKISYKSDVLGPSITSRIVGPPGPTEEETNPMETTNAVARKGRDEGETAAGSDEEITGKEGEED